MAPRRIIDQHLLQALTKAYTARARLFHKVVAASQVDLLIAEIDISKIARVKWDLESLGITATALARVKKAGGKPHQVFAHPTIVSGRPHLIAYYRNLAAISQKGIAQILFATGKYERDKKARLSEEDAMPLCRTLNRILSGVIDAIPDYRVSVSRQVILAEIGAQIQGTWANMVGQGAAKAVEEIMAAYIEKERLGEHVEAGKFSLLGGWTILFASEPDVAFFDPQGAKRIAIEIKGSLDKAGAQTRYGEAKKTFAKQLAENTRCHTVYLASCFTDAVINQIKADGQVRDWFNLTSILYDEQERRRFLDRIFHIVRTPR